MLPVNADEWLAHEDVVAREVVLHDLTTVHLQR